MSASGNLQLGSGCCIQGLGWGGLLTGTSLCLSQLSSPSWALWVTACRPQSLTQLQERGWARATGHDQPPFPQGRSC